MRVLLDPTWNIVPIWNPHLVKDIKLIEKVHHQATKLVQDIRHWKYDNGFKYLSLTRLERRRVRCDLITNYKIMNENLDEVGTRGYEDKLLYKRFRLDVRKLCFSNRIVDKWNSISARCINCN